jgi:hypothetical protein
MDGQMVEWRGRSMLTTPTATAVALCRRSCYKLAVAAPGFSSWRSTPSVEQLSGILQSVHLKVMDAQLAVVRETIWKAATFASDLDWFRKLGVSPGQHDSLMVTWTWGAWAEGGTAFDVRPAALRTIHQHHRMIRARRW